MFLWVERNDTGWPQEGGHPSARPYRAWVQLIISHRASALSLASPALMMKRPSSTRHGQERRWATGSSDCSFLGLADREYFRTRVSEC